MFITPIFHGAQGEDPEAYLRDFNRGCRQSGWSTESRIEVLPDFLEGAALSWYEGLSDEVKGDWDLLTEALKQRFGSKESPNALLLQLDRFIQADGEKISALALRYEALWQRYVRVTTSSSASGGMEHLKMSKFVMALEPRLRAKVMSKDPKTYEEVVQIALRKEASMSIEASFSVPPASPTPPSVTSIKGSSQPHVSALDQNIEKMMQEFQELKLHLVNARPPRAPRADDKTWDKSNVTCYECNEKGHYRPECPKLKKNGEGRVSLLEETTSSEEEEEGEVLMAKRGRGKEKEEKEVDDEEEARKHGGKRKKRSRRRIGQDDFPLGRGTTSYDLLTDLKERKAQITFGQLLAFSPKLRKEWGKLASTREHKKKKKDENMDMVHKIDIVVKDAVPVVDVLIEGQRIPNAYIDGGASINVMSEKAMKDAGLRCSTTSSPYRIKLADNTRVKALGVVKNLEVDVCGISAPTTFQVIPTKPDARAYPVILGRPWL